MKNHMGPKADENTTQAKEPLITPRYCLLILVSFLTAFSYSMIQTLIASYAVDLGGTLGIAGTLTGIFSAAAMVCRPVGGALCDIKNKKTICIIATIIFTVGFFGYAVSMNVPMLLLFRVLHGAAFGVSGTANMALVAEVIPRERMGEGLGYFSVGQVVSQVIGPIIGIALQGVLGFKLLFLFVGFVCSMAVIVLIFMPMDPPLRKTDQNSSAFRFHISLRDLIAVECIAYALTGGMFSMLNGVTSSFLVMVGEQRGIGHIALFFTVNAIILFIVRLLMGKVSDSAPLLWVVSISLAVSMTSMLLLSKAGTLSIVLIAAVFKALGQGSGQISLQSACIKSVDEHHVGVASSTYFIGADIGNSVGPMLGGAISGTLGYEVMFRDVGMITFATIIVFALYEQNVKRSNDVNN